MPISAFDSSTTQAPKRFADPMLSNRAFAIISIVTILLAGILLLAPKAGATDRTWSGTTSTTWSTASNWGGTVPTSSDNAVFTGTFTSGRQPTLTADTVTTGGLWMTGTLGQNVTISGAFNLNLGGNTINGTSGLGILIDNTDARTLTISSSAQLQGDQTWKNSSGNLFTVSGSTKTNAKALTISNTGSGGTTLSGTITGSGAVTINSSGTGITTFSNTGSTYTGQLTVQSGTLKIDTANNSSANGELGNSSASVILGGSGTTGTLEYTGGNASSSKKFTMATGGTGAFQIDANTLTLSGIIDGSGGLSKTGAGGLTLSGVNTYSGGTTVSAGTLTLSGSGTLGSTSGSLTVNGGTLEMNGTSQTVGALSGTGGTVTNTTNTLATLTVGGGNATGSYAGTITDSGNSNKRIALTKTGTGTQTLTGNNSYSSLTTVSQGILNIQNGNALGATAAGTTVSSGATLQVQGGITVGAEALTISGTGAAGQNGALVNVSGTNNYGGLLTLGAASTISSDSGTLNLTNTGTISGNTFGLTLTGAGNGSISSIIGTGTGTLTKTGAGTWTLSGTSANTYTGLTTVSAGELDLGKTANVNAIDGGGLSITGGTVKYTGTSTDEIANTANVSISGGTLDLNNHADTIGSLTFNSGTLTSTGGTQTLTLAGSTATALQMQGSTILSSVNLAFSSATTSGVGMTFDASNNGTATINGNINLNSGATTGVTRTFTINDGTAATDTIITGAITNATSTGLTKAGAGTLLLSGNNTYSGLTTVSAGTLTAASDSALGSSTGANAGLLMNPSAGSATVNFTSATPVIASLASSGAGTSSIVLGNTDGGGTATALTVGGNNASTTFSGTISDGTGTAAGAIGSLTKIGSGTLTLSGANTYTGGTDLNGGILVLGSADAIGTTSTINFGGGTLCYSASNTTDYTSRFSTGASQAYSIHTNGQNVTFAGALTSSGGTLTKLGAGTLVLTGNNTFDGTTTISGGTLDANGTGGDKALGGTSNIVVNTGGTLLTSSAQQFNAGTPPTMTLAGGTFNTNGTSQTLGALTLTTNSIIDLADGASILAFADSSSQTWTSGTIISIYNWTGDKDVGGGTDQLFFGTDTNGLTAGQLSHFQFYSDAGLTAYSAGGVILANGEVVAVPEPATWFGAFLAVGVVACTQRRRFGRLLKRTA